MEERLVLRWVSVTSCCAWLHQGQLQLSHSLPHQSRAAPFHASRQSARGILASPATIQEIAHPSEVWANTSSRAETGTSSCERMPPAVHMRYSHT